jgi:hypothetical protein
MGDEAGKFVSALALKMFGPPADEIGEFLRRKAHYRLNNAERIAERAQKKTRGKDGKVPPRLSYVLLEDGTYSDDELMAEYLGGVLAAGRTPTGQDDRGVTWTKIITSMSVLQLRAHFVLYREWAYALHRRETKWQLEMTRRRAQMYVDMDSLLPILLEVSPGGDVNGKLAHTFSGLYRTGMFESYEYGEVSNMRPTGSIPAEIPFQRAARLTPSIDGMELYGWACGLPGVAPNIFSTTPELVSIEVDVARPKVYFADLDRED